MASVTEKYESDDKVDDWLLNQIVKHVNHGEIGSFARDLRIEESVYSNIPGDKNKTFKVKIFGVRLYFFFHTLHLVWECVCV